MRYLMLLLLFVSATAYAHQVYWQQDYNQYGQPIAKVVYDHGWCEFYYGYNVVPVRSGQWYPYPTGWNCGHY